MKSFEKWKYQELFNHFGLKKVKTLPTLQAWLATETENITESEEHALTKLRLKIEEEIDSWQEDELKSFFIIPLMELIDFRRLPYYKPFTQRNISATVKDLKNEEMELNGRVEFLVAKGLQDPETPFFFVHEYKPEVGTKNDPIGQLLVSMFAAQQLNKDEKEMYGLYIIGRNWFFVILAGREYSISKAYDSTQPQPLIEIYLILKKAKKYIDNSIGYSE